MTVLQKHPVSPSGRGEDDTLRLISLTLAQGQNMKTVSSANLCELWKCCIRAQTRSSPENSSDRRSTACRPCRGLPRADAHDFGKASYLI